MLHGTLMTGRLGAILLGIIISTFGLSASVKMWNPNEFARVLRRVFACDLSYHTWLALAVLVAAAEAVLATTLLWREVRRQTLWACVILLVVYSAVLARIAAMPNAPSCGCLTAPIGSSSSREAIFGIVRNVAMLWMCGLVLRAPPRSRRIGKAHSAPAASRTGFTIVELLVCIAVIAVILAIALPSLAGARTAAKREKQHALFRQMAGAISLYAHDFDSMFPCIVPRGTPRPEIVINGAKVRDAYFQANHRLWLNLILGSYLVAPREAVERPEVRESYVRNGRYPDEVVTTEISLSCTVVATSTYFTDDDHDRPLSLDLVHLRAQSLSEVRYPSQKGLLILGTGGWYAQDKGRDSTIAWMDGSAGLTPVSETDQSRTVTRPWGALPLPVMSTREGLHGVDR